MGVSDQHRKCSDNWDFINNVRGLWQYSQPKTGGPVAVGIQTRDGQALSEKSWKKNQIPKKLIVLLFP